MSSPSNLREHWDARDYDLFNRVQALPVAINMNGHLAVYIEQVEFCIGAMANARHNYKLELESQTLVAYDHTEVRRNMRIELTARTVPVLSYELEELSIHMEAWHRVPFMIFGEVWMQLTNCDMNLLACEHTLERMGCDVEGLNVIAG